MEGVVMVLTISRVHRVRYCQSLCVRLIFHGLLKRNPAASTGGRVAQGTGELVQAPRLTSFERSRHLSLVVVLSMRTDLASARLSCERLFSAASPSPRDRWSCNVSVLRQKKAADVGGVLSWRPTIWPELGEMHWQD